MAIISIFLNLFSFHFSWSS